MDEQDRLQRQMREIGNRYLRRTLDELSQLQELIAGLRSGADQSSGAVCMEEVGRMAHKIYGSGAMFGFEAVSERAREVELLVHDRTGAEFTARLEACVSSLQEQVRAAARARGIE